MTCSEVRGWTRGLVEENERLELELLVARQGTEVLETFLLRVGLGLAGLVFVGALFLRICT